MQFQSVVVRSLVVASLGVATPSLAASASTTDVRVVSAADGAPLFGAIASCLDRPDLVAKSDAAGRASLPAACLKIRCATDGYLPADALRTAEGLLCRLPPGVVVGGRMPAAGPCAAGCKARLLPAEGKPPSLEAPVAAPDPGQPAAFRLATAPPGRWRLEIVRTVDGWTCAADLGVLAPGTRELTVAWREPVSIDLRVLGPDDAPRASARVRAFSRPRGARNWGARATVGAWRCGAASPREGATDEAGQARLDLLDPDQEHLLVAGDWTGPPGIDAKLVATPPREPFTLRPAAPARVVGRVLDFAERAVPCRAELRGAVAAEWLAEVLPPSGLKTECGATGGLSFQPVLSERYTLAIRGDGITPFDRPEVSPRPGETLDLGVLRVPAMDVLPVVVRDEQKRPLAEAQIVAIADAGLMVRREAVTDAEGKARIAGLPMRGTISLGIDAAGFAPWRREELTARDAPVIATLERGAQVEGRVVDPWGNPVGGARVVANPQREDVIRLDAPPPESVSAEDGTFAVRSLDAGVVTLVADARGFEKSNALALTLAAGDVHRGATLTLRPVRDVRGRVLDPRGAPFAGARVAATLWFMVGNVLTAPPLAETVSGPSGEFALPCKSCSDVALVALAPGYGAAAKRLGELAEGLEVELQLQPAATLRILGPAGHAEVRGVWIEDGAGVRTLVPLDRDGRAEAGGLSPGEGSAQLVAERSSRRVAVELRAGETTEVTLALDGAAIEGTVTVDGTPWPGAAIGAVHVDGGEGYYTAFSGDGGRYRMAVAPGDVLVNARGGGGQVTRRIALAPGDTARVDLSITPVFVEVRALDGATRTPVPHLRVWLKPVQASDACAPIGGVFGAPDGDEPGQHITGFHAECDGGGGVTRDDGTATLTVARAGPHELTARKEGYESLSQGVELRTGVNPIELTVAEKRLVRSMRAIPPEGVRGRVACRCGGRWFRESESAPLTCSDLPDGGCELFFRVPGVGIARASVPALEPGETAVPVTVTAGGAIAVAASGYEHEWPTIVDAAGIAWSDAAWILAAERADEPKLETVPDLGPAVVFRDLPPGRYTVARPGRTETPAAVEVTAGGMAVVR